MISEQFDVFLFDLDGVVYIGDEPLSGAVESLARLREKKKIIRFLTNDPCTTRSKIVNRLNRMNIEAHEEEVITSGWATAQYLKSTNLKMAFVLGNNDLKWELRQAGIEITNGSSCDAVVVGWDNTVTFYDIQRAAKYIAQGAVFAATNADKTFPAPEGPLPAVGAIVEAIRVSTGKRPVIVGKPFPSMFHEAIKNLDPSSRIVMIGDNPMTDILGAHQAGLQAVLVGESNTYPAKNDFRNADANIRDLLGLFDPDIQIKKWVRPNYPWPESIKPGVAGIVFDEYGRVLLMKRADNGLWGIPSGHVEPAETVEQAIIREIREETGLEVQVKRLIGVYSDPVSQIFSYPNGEIAHFITNCFECQVIGGSLNKNHWETLDIQFFDIHQLPENLLPMHPKWLADALEQQTSSYIR
ncbi:HAD superfamily hydrolase (TIGR01459 family) [Anoxybacillus vitaminiphilus]|uniref:HAD superfamily hydrolase (TIGR01459 family) n=2 Tax=Bacteria TaxID=2 RepID=A0A327YFN3_9BACL|nr:HAD-IIA family hydrolase [Anoxybacillus vitaminiphilus]RAK18906.1 HAD superfamily hydrolase (TIGR01459 family) [Anoxybacillus vitaminiphilus]